MDAQSLKASLLDRIQQIDSLDVLQALSNLLDKQEGDWWDELSEAEQADIDASIEEAERGEVIPHEEVMANPKKWL